VHLLFFCENSHRCHLQLVFGACATVLAVVSISIRVQVIACLAEIGCLVGELLCAVLDLVVGLVVEIIACLLPQIAGCINVIAILDIKVIIKVLGLVL